MNFEFFETLKPKPVIKKDVILKGAGKNNIIKAKIAENVVLRIGPIVQRWDVVVGDIADSLLLGLDFMKRHQGIVNIKNMTLTLDQKTIPITKIKTQNSEEVEIYRVSLQKRTVIPPQSVKFASIHTDKPFQGSICIETVKGISSGLMPPNSLIGSIQQTIPFRNPTDRYITLKKGQNVGFGIEIKDFMYLNENEEVSVNKIEVSKSSTVSPSSSTSELKSQLPVHLQKLFSKSIVNLEQKDHYEVFSLIDRFQSVFAKDDFDLGLFNGEITHKIDTGEARPIKQRLRRTPMGFENEEKKHIEQMLEQGIIQPSISEWASAPVLVRKKDGKLRFCIDYRALNKVTTKDAFPIPNIQDCMDTLGGNAFFSTLDMASGYWQILVDEKDRSKTAFTTKYGLYEHVRLPFGLCNSPATFSRVIQQILRGLTWQECLAYLDDVIIFGSNMLSHTKNLSAVLARFEMYDLKLKPQKCALYQSEIKFLGKLVSTHGISAHPESTEIIKKWPVPKDIKQLESFLGFANYHRNHVKNFAELSHSLYQLIKISGKSKFEWSETHEKAFDEIKKHILQALTLAHPNSQDTFVLDTDASDNSIGAELSQIQNGKEQIISFASKVLTPTQKKYCTTRKELLAIITFTRQFRHFLLGNRFILRTDHNSLIWLLNFKNIEGQLARWIEELSQYNIILQHRPGKYHSNADALSRIPDSLDLCQEYRSGIELSQLPCGGCHFCTRAKQQWSTFEDDIDYVVPLTVRSINNLDSIPLGLSDILVTEELAESQDEDDDIQKIKTWLESKIVPTQKELSLCSPSIRYLWSCKSQLHLRDGILYYLWEDQIQPRYIFVVPKNMQPKVLEYCHDNRSAGHLGQTKTYEKLKQCSIWYGMSQDSKLYVENCKVCNKNKKPNIKPRAALGEYHAGYPLHRVHFDILGPLPVTKQGNKYILMIIDQFTKWLEIVPIPNQNSITIAKAMVDNFISKYGCPSELHSDQGKNVDGVLIRKLCDLLQIAKTRTTAYHPQSNGQVERYNRLVLQAIRCYINNKQSEWDIHLQQIAGAIRATENRQTKFTPNFLFLGRETTQPIDLILGTCNLNNPEKDIPEYVQDLRTNMVECHEIARSNICKAQHRQKRYYDTNLYQNTYNVGDVVLKVDSATTLGQSSKLKSPWKGPYVILEVKSPVLFKIIDRKNRESVIHHDRIKLCKDLDHPGWVKRIRNRIFSQAEYTEPSEDNPCSSSSVDLTEPDRIITDIHNLFTTSDEASDILMPDQEDSDDLDLAISSKEQGYRTRGHRMIHRPKYLSDYIQD